MRHRKFTFKIGRTTAHRRAMLANAVSSLYAEEQITTTVVRAKQIRRLAEKCITTAKRALPSIEAAAELACDAERGSDEWKAWRNGEQWQKWNQAIAPSVAARRQVLKLIRDKDAVATLFEDIAPRYVERNGGYTRIMRLGPRVGDGAETCILQLVDSIAPAVAAPAEAEDAGEEEKAPESSDE